VIDGIMVAPSVPDSSASWARAPVIENRAKSMNVAAIAAAPFAENFTKFLPMLLCLLTKTCDVRRNLMPRHPPNDTHYLK
jgi:hypothetical protein